MPLVKDDTVEAASAVNAVADTSAVLDDLARGDLMWQGHQYGFDWYLEKARREMAGEGGFSPLRMTFWRPTEKVEELSRWDAAYIIFRNLGQMVGLPSVDNAPVAKIDKYTGSWLTFLRKVTNGRLEDLAGGPLFLMLEKYFLVNGELEHCVPTLRDISISCGKMKKLTTTTSNFSSNTNFKCCSNVHTIDVHIVSI